MRTTVWILMAALLGGCAQFPHQPSKDADVAFNRLANDYLAGYLAWRPQAGTALGLHEYDGLVTDASQASIDRELRRLERFSRALAAIDSKKLSPRSFYDYRILRSAVDREIFSFDQMQIFTRNPMTYAGALDVSIYIKRDFAPLESRVRSIIHVLRQAPAIMAAARANLAAALPRPQVETAILMAEGAVDFLAKDLVEGIKDLPAGDLRSEFEQANRSAIAELRGYAEFLKRDKLPHSTGNYALGREKYMQMLRCGENVTLTPENILKIGMRELRLAQQDFARTARQIDPGKDPVVVFKEIQKDHPTEQNLIPDTARHLENIRQFLVDHHIVTLPSSVRAQVAETPKFLRATSFASMDTPGPFETKATQAYYYVTPPEADWPPAQKEEWLTAMNFYTTDIVSIHEAYPGHYVQFLCLNASPANKLEKIFTSYAFTEGWAHYAEQMMIEQGFGRDATTPLAQAKYHLAQIDEALLRLCRLCVSIQMHCQGMSVDEATRFFQENCYYEQKTARAEAVRGAYDPEYLYYTLGKLEILKLRDDYRRQEGASFSLQAFHDELLRHGAPPIRLLRELMLKNPGIWDDVL